VICPECGDECPVHDRGPERPWRHLDTMQFETLLQARLPRARRPECGVKTIEVLRAASNIEAACKLLGLDWSAAKRIMKNTLARGLDRRDGQALESLGFDEKILRRGRRCLSLLNDLNQGRVIKVVEGRDENSVSKLFVSLTDAQREKVEAIAVDRWKAFMKASTKACPNANHGP